MRSLVEVPGEAEPGPRSILHLARMRAGLDPCEGIRAVPPDRRSVHAAGGKPVLSWRQWYETVEVMAAALRRLGLAPGERVLILGETRLEWFQADLAVMAAGGWTVPAYPTLPAAQIEEILSASATRLAFVSRPALCEELLRSPEAARALRACIVMEGSAAGASVRPAAERVRPPAGKLGRSDNGDEHTIETEPDRRRWPRILSWQEALESGREAPSDLRSAITERARSLRPESTATIIWTSGTAGRMKGVVLTHGNLLASALSSARRLEVASNDVYLSFLPLSHVLERVVHLSMLAAGASIHYGEGLDRLEQDFRRVRPTIVVGVPRLFEKILLEAKEQARRKGRRLLILFRLAEHAARRAGRRGPASRPHGPLGWFWDLLVYRKIRRALGGRVRCLISGGAPLGRREALFLNGCGLCVLEGYGLTETASVLAVNVPGAWRLGSVGRPLPGVEVSVAEDGEILVRGPSVMRGYFRGGSGRVEDGGGAETAEAGSSVEAGNVAEAGNSVEAVDSGEAGNGIETGNSVEAGGSIEAGNVGALDGGWLRTGDVGRLDADGYLFILDRKKDLIATSQGKKVAPQLVESAIRRSPLVREAVVLGERRPFLVALIFPDLERLRARLGLMLAKGPELMKSLNSKSVHALMRAEIDHCCRDLAPHERVREFLLIPRAPEVADGTLTPTQKVRRGEIQRLHAAEINRLYQRPVA